MTCAYDHYAATWRLIAALRDETFDEAARALEDAMAAGFTSSEILMALRWHLRQFLAAHPGASPAVRRKAEDLERRIDATLAP